MDQPGPPTAVVVDEWPLVRVGITQNLRALEVAVVGDVAGAEEGVRVAETTGARLLLLGTVRDLPLPEAARRARALAVPPKIIVLVDRIDREDARALRAVGIDAMLPRSVGPSDLADAVTRVGKGERVVAPALLTLLVGFLGPPEPAPDSGGVTVPAGHPEALTRKELEVLARLAEGRSNREIADALYVTPATVKSHLAHIYVKLGVAGRQEAMARAVALGLLG